MRHLDDHLFAVCPYNRNKIDVVKGKSIVVVFNILNRSYVRHFNCGFNENLFSAEVNFHEFDHNLCIVSARALHESYIRARYHKSRHI